MTKEDEKNLDNSPPPKNAVPIKDRLSWPPEEAAAITGIGLTRIREAAAACSTPGSMALAQSFSGTICWHGWGSPVR
jgi:hypothetical protein